MAAQVRHSKNTYKPPPDPPLQKAMLTDLSHVLDSATRCATFTCGGSLPILTNPATDASGQLASRTEESIQDQRILTEGITLRWGPDGHGRIITLPLQDGQGAQAFNDLLDACVPATFGRGGEDVYDETYRRASALGAQDFMTDFCPYEAGIIDIVTQILLPPITSDLKPQPPRSEIAEAHNLTRAQEMELRYIIHRFSRVSGPNVRVAHVEVCLDALRIPAASAEEMLSIRGELDPAGTGFVEMEVLVDFAAGRFKQMNPTEAPDAQKMKEERRRMVRQGIRAEPSKLNVYSGPSGLFRPHVDTPRNELQIGSLVVCLPVPFEGGKLAVRHQREEVVYDWSTSSSTDGTPCVQ